MKRVNKTLNLANKAKEAIKDLNDVDEIVDVLSPIADELMQTVSKSKFEHDRIFSIDITGKSGAVIMAALLQIALKNKDEEALDLGVDIGRQLTSQTKCK